MQADSNFAAPKYHCTTCDSKNAYADRRTHQHFGKHVPYENFEVCVGQDCTLCKDLRKDKLSRGKSRLPPKFAT